MAKKSAKPALAQHLSEIRVPVTDKQFAMLQQLDAEVVAAGNRRVLVLNTIAAAASYDGECDFVGIEEVKGKKVLVLRPKSPPADPA